jgi:hypothetical protein
MLGIADAGARPSYCGRAGLPVPARRAAGRPGRPGAPCAAGRGGRTGFSGRVWHRRYPPPILPGIKLRLVIGVGFPFTCNHGSSEDRLDMVHVRAVRLDPPVRA